VTGGTGSEVLLRESDGGILTLTLHRPEAYNAIDTQLRDALLDALVLALGADHCVAASDARLSAPFVARALVPDGASIYLLPRLVGTARARRMLLFGEGRRRARGVRGRDDR
jgi:enoyl-CoA hydratase/carnithine racemase